MANLKEYILNTIDEQFIFSYYLNIPITTIEECVQKGTKIRNPLREDKHPSAGFKFKRNKLILTDYAQPYFSGDVFYITGLVLGYNSFKKNDFINICNTIIKDIILNKKVISKYRKSKLKPKDNNSQKEKKFTTIIVEYMKWDVDTFKYWYDHIKNKEIGYVLLKVLQEFNIYPISAYWLNNNNRASKLAKKDNPIYAYLLGIDKQQRRHYKLYMPKEEKRKKFVTNSDNKLNYLNLVKENNNLVLIKSIKDMIFLTTFARYYKIYDITFLPVSTENVIFKKEEFKKITKKFNNIFTFYDYDKTGILYSFYNEIIFGTKPIFISTKYNINLINREDLKLIENDILEIYPNFNIVDEFIKFKTRIRNKFTNTRETKDFADCILKYGYYCGYEELITIRTLISEYIQELINEPF